MTKNSELAKGPRFREIAGRPQGVREGKRVKVTHCRRATKLYGGDRDE